MDEPTEIAGTAWGEPIGPRTTTGIAQLIQRVTAAESRASELEHALENLVDESESSWDHHKVEDEDYCRGCGFAWPCSTVRARALLPPPTQSGSTQP